MKYSINFAIRRIRALRRNRKGSVVAMLAVVLPALLGIVGMSIDVGYALVAKRQLDASTQGAALAGAYEMLSTNTSSAVQTAITNWNTANPPTGVTIASTSTPTLSCVTSTSNLPSCNSSTPNTVSVTQTATVSTHFLKAFGFSSFSLSSTASAAMAGGNPKSLNIMFIMDATGSMSNSEPGCVVPNNSNPSKFQCALAAVQNVLKTAPTTLDKASLSFFPASMTSYSPTNSKSCGSQASSVPYYTTSDIYQAGTGWSGTGAWRSDFNNGNGSLNDSSPLVVLIGDYSNKVSNCLQNPGGEGSFAAEAIDKAVAAMPTATAGTSNVIIIASDGGYASTKFASGQTSHATAQCGQAVTAASNATKAGITVYSIAYDAAGTGCSSGDTITPCQAMQQMASSSATFYTTDSSCMINNSPNPVADLPTIFQSITTSFTKPRLLSNTN